MQIPVYRYIKTKEGWEKTISFIPKNSLSLKNPTILLVSYQTIFHMYYVYKLPKNKTKELYKKMNTEESLKKKPQIVSQKMINLRNPLDLDKYSK